MEGVAGVVSSCRAIGSRRKTAREKTKVKVFFPLINSLNQFSGVQASTRKLSPFGMSSIS